MKRNILLAVTALMIALAMTACSPNANNQGPIIVGPSGTTNRPMSSSDAARAFADNFSFGAALDNATVSGSTATVDFATNPYSYTDAEGNQWTVNDGTLEYTFSDAAAGSSASLLSNGSMTSYTVKTIEPLTIAYSKGSYTLTIGETTAACDVTLSANSVTVNSMTQPSSISINGTTVAPTTPAYTLVSTAEGLKTAIEEGGEIAISGSIEVADNLSITKATHLFGVSDTAKLILKQTISNTGSDYGLITVTSNDVVIEDLSVEFAGTVSQSYRGTRMLKAQYNGTTPITGFVLRNVTFTPGTGIAAVNLHGTSGALLENVTVAGVEGMPNVALSIADSQNLTIKGGSYSAPGQYADIQINYAEATAETESYRGKTSSVTFKDFGADSGLIFATNPSNGSHDIKGFTEANTATAELGIASFKISGTYYNASPALVDQIGLLNYFKSFGHKRVMVDITSILTTGKQYVYTDGTTKGNGTLELGEAGITANEEGTEISIPLTAEGYHYCGSGNDATISGSLIFTLTGSKSDNTFTASGYSVSGTGLTLSGGDKDMTINLTGVAGDLATTKFLGGNGIPVTEPTDKNLVITLATGESTDFASTTDYDDDGDGSHALWIPSSGTVATTNATVNFGGDEFKALLESAIEVITEMASSLGA